MKIMWNILEVTFLNGRSSKQMIFIHNVYKALS